ncbi:hypothetical protein CRYUN_Cryun20dG0123600 [Craigia yunnanensis]
MLVCSYRKSSANSLEGSEEKPAKHFISALDAEPRIVVIMAGNDKPTYLATPKILLENSVKPGNFDAGLI